jgi:Domain of unknown function (DUF4279)
VRISQYVYFDLSSHTVTAETITSRLGIQPDQTLIRGSRRAEPPIPTRHHWSVHCRERGLCVDDQITVILDRVEPVRAKILDVISGGEVFARLQIVRNFDDESGEEEVLDSFVTPGGGIAEKVPGQHQLLGWILSAEQVAVLASMRATIDSDEYG